MVLNIQKEQVYNIEHIAMLILTHVLDHKASKYLEVYWCLEQLVKMKFRQFIPDRWLISLVISLEVLAFHRQMSPFKCPDAGK